MDQMTEDTRSPTELRDDKRISRPSPIVAIRAMEPLSSVVCVAQRNCLKSKSLIGLSGGVITV